MKELINKTDPSIYSWSAFRCLRNFPLLNNHPAVVTRFVVLLKVIKPVFSWLVILGRYEFPCHTQMHHGVANELLVFLWFYFANGLCLAIFRRHWHQRYCSFRAILFAFCRFFLFCFGLFALYIFIFRYSETYSTQWAHLNLIWSNLWFV